MVVEDEEPEEERKKDEENVEEQLEYEVEFWSDEALV